MDVQVVKRFLSLDSEGIGEESMQLQRACQENILIKALLADRLLEAQKAVLEQKLKESILKVLCMPVVDTDTILDAKECFLAEVAEFPTPKMKESAVVWYRGVQVA
eukprot:9618207-Lingulodinium_polyedra.AAC.1